MSIPLCVGVFAEGKTDYAFLLKLLDQLLPELAHTRLSRVPIIDDSVGIDAPGRPPPRRADRIASAIHEYWWAPCTLFVIHSDGNRDPERAFRETIEPGITAARGSHPELAVAACVPVREIEAWLLAGQKPFEQLLRSTTSRLPSDPEAVGDPKLELERLLAAGDGPKLDPDIYAFFGANADLASLRRLPAFQRFEDELATAIKVAAGEH